MIRLKDTTLSHGLFLAPLAGYTDFAMRTVARELGAEFTVSEMVSARALCYRDKKTPILARIGSDELPAAVQIFGSEPSFMAEAAGMVAEGMAGGVPPTAIDINMGCPVKKIVSAGDGSALMKDPRLAADIVTAVVKAISLPVTVKIRAGWDEEHKNAVEMAKMLEAAGAALITVHGRTRAQMYGGVADRTVIAAVKAAVKIPVVANGDVFTAQDALSLLLETGCDGVMVGRGAVGNPFLFREIAAAMEGRTCPPPTPEERVRVALRHLSLAVADKGERVAVNESRKQFADYFAGLRGAASLRAACSRAEHFDELCALAERFLAETE